MADKKPTARQRRAAIVRAYKQVFNTPEGKMILNDLMKRGNMMAPMMAKGRTQEDLFHKEGERNIVLYILSTINVDNEILAEMIKDSTQEDRRNAF